MTFAVVTLFVPSILFRDMPRCRCGLISAAAVTYVLRKGLLTPAAVASVLYAAWRSFRKMLPARASAYFNINAKRKRVSIGLDALYIFHMASSDFFFRARMLVASVAATPINTKTRPAAPLPKRK
jgi:hypothetical protein